MQTVRRQTDTHTYMCTGGEGEGGGGGGGGGTPPPLVTKMWYPLEFFFAPPEAEGRAHVSTYTERHTDRQTDGQTWL